MHERGRSCLPLILQRKKDLQFWEVFDFAFPSKFQVSNEKNTGPVVSTGIV